MQQQKPQNSQPLQQPHPQVPLTAQLFLFRQLIIDMLNHCKKNIKISPFDEMSVDRLVDNNFTRNIDIYQQYFLIGIGTPKTRELICNRYQRLLREGLVNRDCLPPQMITGIINARSAIGGGSTASSGSNSGVGSAMNLSTDKSIQIGKLITTILSLTMQPSSQIGAGLQYLLQGTKNKNNGNQFALLIQESYTNLCKYRKKPLDRFLQHFVYNIVNQVEYHQAPYYEYEKKFIHPTKKQSLQPPSSSTTKYKQMPQLMQTHSSPQPQIPPPPQMHPFIRPQPITTLKQRLCTHNDQDAKYGKCFICQKLANNCDKNICVPLCGMQCKLKLKRINQEIIMSDHFVMLKWILQAIVGVGGNGLGEEVLYGLLVREVADGGDIVESDIGAILEIIVGNFGLHNIGIVNGVTSIQNIVAPTTNKVIQNSSIILSYLIKKYTHQMLQPATPQPITSPIRPCLPHTKILLTQLVRLLQSLPIQSNPLQLTLLRSLLQILSTKQTNTTNLNKYIVLKEMFLCCDCKILETNLVERAFNVVSQYALVNNGVVGTSGAAGTNVSLQNLGTSTSIGSDTTNAISMGMINNSVSLSSSSCVQTAITSLDQLLSSMLKFLPEFSTLQSPHLPSILLQKKCKKYIQTKFTQQFNKKPIKAVQSLRNLFNNKITPKDIALILKQNIDYQTKVKKSLEKINKQEIGTYFGTLKKDKNGVVDDYNLRVYREFLGMLQKQYEGREIDDCLRITFNAFMMPKEGQQVQVVLGPLSLALQPHLGLKVGDEATATYQLIMVSLMVQTSNNPNVKQNQKIKYDGFKKFCTEIDANLSQQRMLSIYQRIKKRPLQILMQYKGIDVFTKKYVNWQQTQTQFWKHITNLAVIEDKKQGDGKVRETKMKIKKIESDGKSSVKEEGSIVMEDRKFEKKQEIVYEKIQEKIEENVEQKKQQVKKQQIKQGKIQQQTQIKEISSPQKQLQVSQQIKMQPLSKNSIQWQNEPQTGFQYKNLMSFTLQTLWQYIYMSLVNRSNLRGLQQCCILYGNSQLLTQFQAFFNHLYKLHIDFQQRSSSTLQSIGNQAKLILLKLAIDNSNNVIGRQSWLTIIKIIYKIDGDQQNMNRKQLIKKGQNLYIGYQYDASDKLFTRSNLFEVYRLREFLEAMCQFSSSQVKTDKKYTREMYILHHIAEIIQYNLDRFQFPCSVDYEVSLWQVLWPTIRSYYRNICLHPRKQICMSAIDSYKQLSMKILKLPKIHHSSLQQTHTQLFSIYLYIFQRSPSYIKDLILNILLNVVCPQMKSGWNQLYSILEISDCEDKNIIMKVVGRIMRDVGLENVENLMRLHGIVVKELRIGGQGGDERYVDVMEVLWGICQFFGRIDVWLETMSKVKDIFKSSTHAIILRYFYKLCNKCIMEARQLTSNQYQEQVLSPIKHKLHQIPLTPKKDEDKSKENKSAQDKSAQDKSGQELQQQIEQNYLRQSMEKPKIKTIIMPEQAHKLIYFQIFSIQMHILEIKNAKLYNQCVNAFIDVQSDVFFRNIGNQYVKQNDLNLNTEKNSRERQNSSGGRKNSREEKEEKTGFLTLWQMFINNASNNYNVVFAYFVKDYLSTIFQKLQLYSRRLQSTPISQQSDSIRSLPQLMYIKRQLLQWLLKQVSQATKDQILNLCQQDQDLNKSFTQIFEHYKKYLSSPSPSTNKTELIEFYLSSKEYENKAVLLLVFIKTLKLFFQYEGQTGDEDGMMGELKERVLGVMMQGYANAEQVNEKPLLRYFLWNNDFFKGLEYLPGLIKQEIRTYQIIIKHYRLEDKNGKVLQTILKFIKKYINKSQILSQKPIATTSPIKKPGITTSSSPQKQQAQQQLKILQQDLLLYITNSQQLIIQSLQKLNKQLIQQSSTKQNKGTIQQEQETVYRQKQIFQICLDLIRCCGSKGIVREASVVMGALVDNLY